MSPPSQLVDALLDAAGARCAARGSVAVTGADPVLPTRFRIGEAAAAALAASAVAAADLHVRRGGPVQDVAVDVGAATASLLGFALLRTPGRASERWEDRQNITDFYATRDGRWVLVHGGFPHLQQGILDLLGVRSEAPAPRDAVAEAIAEREAAPLEDEIAERRLCGAVGRSEAAWRAHAQGRALAAAPVVEVIRFADTEPIPLPPLAARPLEGLRLLDLTRVLAGPTCARTLAAHGAEVLKITGPGLPHIPLFVRETGHGKRSAQLDLRAAAGVETLRALVADADVFSQGYRSGALARLGFGPEALHDLRPGIVYVSIDCYGHEGPWRERGGWEQLAQTVTGVAAENGGEGQRPRLLPAAATDYTTGYLGALGTLVALQRRAEEGGSFHVRVSLSRTAMWLQSLGRCDGEPSGLSPERLSPWMTTSRTADGLLEHLGPVVSLSATPAAWRQPTAPLGAHPPRWTGPRAR